MSRPEPQPASAPSRVKKVREQHPAISAGGAERQEPARQAEKQETQLVPFNARIPRDLRQQYRWLSVSTGRSIQDLATDALRQYANVQQDQAGQAS